MISILSWNIAGDLSVCRNLDSRLEKQFQLIEFEMPLPCPLLLSVYVGVLYCTNKSYDEKINRNISHYRSGFWKRRNLNQLKVLIHIMMIFICFMDKIFIVFPVCTFSIFRLHLVDIENEKTFFHSINI